jgi:hypothetical protein
MRGPSRVCEALDIARLAADSNMIDLVVQVDTHADSQVQPPARIATGSAEYPLVTNLLIKGYQAII